MCDGQSRVCCVCEGHPSASSPGHYAYIQPPLFSLCLSLLTQIHPITLTCTRKQLPAVDLSTVFTQLYYICLSTVYVCFCLPVCQAVYLYPPACLFVSMCWPVHLYFSACLCLSSVGLSVCLSIVLPVC